MQCLNSVVNTEGLNGQARDILASIPKAACYLTTVAAAAAGGGRRWCQCKISLYKAHRFAQTNARYLQSIKMLHPLV